jgi:hypothetical protein
MAGGNREGKKEKSRKQKRVETKSVRKKGDKEEARE